MHSVDTVVLVVYFAAILGVGLWFLRKNEDDDDYYLGGRAMGAGHIGLSVVATDVGGGFSIGLGGLGFAMGMSGSWMLFTGLVGAWLAAVLLIPKVHALGTQHGLSTYPQLFGLRFDRRVATAGAVVSAIGYIGFTASQLRAGAKLASSSIEGLDAETALLAMGALAVVYTSFGGMKAVIYTDTVQWILLMVGLILVGLPIAYHELGGMKAIRAALPEGHLSLTRVDAVQLVNWGLAIVPIWFVGMTLYQRVYASRDAATAKRAWLFAGLLEWPVMAMLGVALGVLGRVAWTQGRFAEAGYASGADLDPERALPLLLVTLLPIGLKGLMLAAYFSAILSTADSCLMAASGNLNTDLAPAREGRRPRKWRAPVFTLGTGTFALLLAWRMENVLDLMLHSYAFMVGGLLVPTIAGLFGRRPSSAAAIASMVTGGTTTVVLPLSVESLPLGLDPIAYGLAAATATFVVVQRFDRRR